jgi:cytochrome c-type biogenesis protein CcmE
VNSRLRRRLAVVTGIVVIVVIAVLAVVQGATGSRSVTVAEAAAGLPAGQRVQVTGQVVDNSFTVTGDTLTFAIYDPTDPVARLTVRYTGAMSATFGNQVTAICTGKIAEDGALECSELVTKCPSKYEGAADALSVSQLLGYGSAVADLPVKVTGQVQPGSIGTAATDQRLVITDLATGQELPVSYAGGLPAEVSDGTVVVLTGSIGADGCFIATDIAIKE